MFLLRTLSGFIWFSFLYQTVNCAIGKTSDNDLTAGSLSQDQKQQLLDELAGLDQQQRKHLFDDLQRQGQEFERSRHKWARLRQALPRTSDISPVSQAEVDGIRKSIRNRSSPVVRNKRTLKFLVSSLAEILGLRWALLKYSLIPAAVNVALGPPPPAAPAPAAPAAPGKPGPPPPPGPRPPPPKPAPPRRPPPPAPKPAPPAPPPPAPAPAKPGAPAPPARPPPPTIPPNQIDPNTIRYPFRPAPTIPFLNFAPLPPGVTVPYPPLFQWPTPAPAPAGAMPPQPPCAAPPPAPKAPPPPPPKTPSRLPLPRPRKPVPPPPKPVRPVLPASPGKTPLKLEYDHPVRIEIFNNVKSVLPASGSLYSGEPTQSSLEEQDETERYMNPTQAIQAIDEQYNTESGQGYNTEPAQEYNKDYDYGYFTRTPNHLTLDDERPTSPQRVSDYDDDERHNHYENTEKSHEDYDDRNQNHEETTPEYSGYSAYNDYPEQAEENRPNVNIRVRTSKSSESKKAPKRIRNPKKFERSKKIDGSESKNSWNSVFDQSTKSPWTVKSFPPSAATSSPKLVRGKNRFVKEREPLTSTTTEFPNNHARKFRTVLPKGKYPAYNATSNNFLVSSQSPVKWFESHHGTTQKYQSPLSRGDSQNPSSPYQEFRIVVPHAPARTRRDLFFDDEFKNFDSSTFEAFQTAPDSPSSSELQSLPESTHSQYLDTNREQVTSDDEYRQKLEKDVEKYVEQYVEQQITNGEIDLKKPKTTIVELKPKDGPPIKTVTTTLTKVLEGKPFLESILEYSKEINPVADIGQPSGEAESTEPSEVSKAFQNTSPTSFEGSFSWSFSSLS